MVDAIFVIFMVFHVLISEVALTENPGNGTCGTPGGGFKCCTDYKRNGSRCVPCIGSFGLGCTNICPPRYYGFGCRKKCECEQCDKLNGSCIVAMQNIGVLILTITFLGSIIVGILIITLITVDIFITVYLTSGLSRLLMGW
ncbi:uncharacterized protein LOC125679373 [Ostrea edulis]|uniref:uncharacterized protein LOC125679373 n=1 Tax=Ostrea edulis TaxID=37623 RepID=UPI0024AFBD74|nr:uncharacterized protein LOC125679373 [Ostrea edulis]